MAMSADGKVDTADRRGARISSVRDGRRVQELRAEVDAVMVGGRTLAAEDPRLTVREPDLVARRIAAGRPAQPMKVAVASVLPEPGSAAAAPLLPEPSRFLADGSGRPVIVTTTQSSATARAAMERRGATVVVAGDKRVDLAAALDWLAAAGVERLLVEGGGTLVAGLLERGLVDELRLFVAPLLLGGATAPTPVGGPGLRREDAVDLTLESTEAHPDGGVVLRYLVRRAPGSEPDSAPRPSPQVPA